MMRFLIYILCFVFALSFNSCASRVVVKQPSSAIVVKKRPANYRIVTVRGKRYYFWNGKHYRKTRKGYVIVSL